jgi:hypothetical protein
MFVKNNMVTYFPKVIPVENEKGVISWVPPRAKIIGELVKKPKRGRRTFFNSESHFPAINQEREIKGGDWVVTYKKFIGRGLEFDPQLNCAKNQGEDKDIAEFDETIYAIFMYFVKTRRCWLHNNREIQGYPWIRFKEKTVWGRNVCGFDALNGLFVNYAIDDAGPNLCILVARKSRSVSDAEKQAGDDGAVAGMAVF